MRIEISFWCAHHNMLLFSAYWYCEMRKIKLNISFGHSLPSSCAIMRFEGASLFFDYSDDILLNADPLGYDFYFKRSLLPKDYHSNIRPLNFQAIFSYKALKFVTTFNVKEFIQQRNKAELLRALDYFGIIAKMNHAPMDIRRFPDRTTDNGGQILFYTRLWNPDNTKDLEEKQRRVLQNEFRIGACRVIRKHFNNASVGIYPDALAARMAPDVLMDKKSAVKKNYFETLAKSDICIADDGLKDTPGWKIGEYLLFGKAVITTPIATVVENFDPGTNFLQLDSRSSFDQIPHAIRTLLSNKEYGDMGERNFQWSAEYLHPSNYLARIFSQTIHAETHQ